MTMKFYILDKDHHPIEIENFYQWAEWMYGFEGRNSIVKQTQVSPEVLVSTIFLGMNLGLTGYGPPAFFETMIFAENDDIDRDQWRWSSWDDAMMNHEAIVRKLHAKLKEKAK